MEVREPDARYLPAVQRSELGELPADWKVAPLGEFDPFITSGSRGWAAYFADIGSTFLRITNLSRSCIYPSLRDLRYVAVPPDNSEGVRTALRAGDVLISITADIGIVGLVTEAVELPAYINQHIALVRFDGRDVNSRYVAYFLAGASAQRRFKSMTDAGAKAGMNLAGVRDVLAALPPSTDEQAAIADALTDADTLIDSLEQAPRKISPFDGIGLLDLIVKTGIADAIAERLADMNGNRESIAETIENNVRSKILKEQLTDPAYFAKMSALLDEIIRLRKERAIEYEDYLARIADVAKQVAAGKSDDTPKQLKTTGQLALYNNMKDHVVADAAQQPEAVYGGTTKALDTALLLDTAIKTKRPDGWRGVVAKEQLVKQAMFDVLNDIKEDGWRGVVAKEQLVKQAMFDVLNDIKEVNRLFPIVFAQKEY